MCEMFANNWESTSGDNETEPTEPLMFVVDGQERVKSIYVTAHEFSAQEGIIYLPARLMQEAFIPEGGKVTVDRVCLPKISSLKLQPRNNKFAEQTSEPKIALEEAIVSRYQVLTLGDTIQVNGHELTVIEMTPSTSCITHNSDPEVDFSPSEEQLIIDKEREEREKKEQEIAKQKADEEAMRRVQKQQHPEDSIFRPFTGQGRRLDGSVIETNVAIPERNGDMSPVASQPSIRRQRRPNTGPSQRPNFKAFGGEGRKLGTR